MFSHKDPQQAAGVGRGRRDSTDADEVAYVIDNTHDEMRGPGTALGLGRALRDNLPPSVTGEQTSRGGPRTSTQDEEAEQAFRAVADRMTVVFNGTDEDPRGFIKGNPDEDLQAVVVRTEDRTWVARGAEATFMGANGWEIDQIDPQIVEVLLEVHQPAYTYLSDLPSEDPNEEGAVYRDGPDSAGISHPEESDDSAEKPAEEENSEE